MGRRIKEDEMKGGREASSPASEGSSWETVRPPGMMTWTAVQDPGVGDRKWVGPDASSFTSARGRSRGVGAG